MVGVYLQAVVWEILRELSVDLVKELSLLDLIFTAVTMLIGEEHTDWAYYDGDLRWWQHRLYISRN